MRAVLGAALVAGSLGGTAALAGVPGLTGVAGATTTVSTWTQLVTAFTTSGATTVQLTASFAAPSGDHLVVQSGATITLDLNGRSLTITHPAEYEAAIQVIGALTIETGDLGTGKLTATGGTSAAGIGGDAGASGGTVTIEGGTVTATGSTLAAGIGGGAGGSGGTVTIEGGTVTATGSQTSAGIGGGWEGSGGTVTIEGGTVTATGGESGAGIGGGGAGGAGGTITIEGGTVTASGHTAGGAGIGGGGAGSGGTVTIEGGTVTATGSTLAAGIGGGIQGSGATVTIGNGARVTAIAGTTASAVGPGYDDDTFGTLTNRGSLTLETAETIASGAHATNTATGVITLETKLAGGGTLTNTGTVLLGTGGLVTGTVTVTEHDYVVTFTLSTVSGTTKPASQTVYASSFGTDEMTLPTLPGYEWASAASGGVRVTATTDLSTLFGEHTTRATAVTLHLVELVERTLFVRTGSSGTTCTSAVTGSGSGDACGQIQTAVTKAETYGSATAVTITVGPNTSPSTYKGDISISAGNLASLTIEGKTGLSSTTVTGKTSTRDFSVTGGSVTISGLSIDHGLATGTSGGGVDNTGTLTLTGDEVSHNVAEEGGGVYNSGTVTLSYDTISDDSATATGGGLDNVGISSGHTATATITDVTYSTDKARYGGGVTNFGDEAEAAVTMSDDTFSGDSTTEATGGAVGNYAYARQLATATIIDDTFWGDMAATSGGGVVNEAEELDSDAVVTMTDDTFWGDMAATSGGGLVNGAEGLGTAAVVTMTDDTFSDDTATDTGGAIWNFSTTDGVAEIAMTASIVDGSSCSNRNGGTTAAASGTYDVTTTATCNFDSTATGDETVSASALGLATQLAANGSTGPETLAIGPTSAAFEHVPEAVCTAVKTDERGDPRPGFPGKDCDSGAYEYQRPVAVVTSATVPGAPTLTTATPGTGTVELVWTAPSSDGGATITNYRVCYATTSAAVTTCATSKTAGTATSLTVTGLTDGTTYYFAVKADNSKGYGSLSNTKTATPAKSVSPTTIRVYGQGSDTTAAAELTRAFPYASDSCPTSRAVVLATTKTYDDALSSQFLAQSLTTGTLLTPTTKLSTVTATTLKEEGITTVYVVGGPLAITTTVVKAIEALTAYECGGTTKGSTTGKVAVTRLYGTTQYGTAEAIAEHVGTAASKAFAGAYATTNATGGTGKYNDTGGKGSSAPSGSVSTAILTSGEEFQDAQAASIVAYRTKLPLLLTPATTLSTTAVAAIEKLGIKQVVLMGGTLAVTNTVEAALVAKTGVAVLRVAGKDYTDTAVELARFEIAGATAGLGWTPDHRVLVARGNGFTDGIAGAVLDSPHDTATGAAGTARPLLLTESQTTVGTYLTTFLKVTGHTGIDKTAAKTITGLTVLGGPLALSTAVVTQMETDLSH